MTFKITEYFYNDASNCPWIDTPVGMSACAYLLSYESLQPIYSEERLSVRWDSFWRIIKKPSAEFSISPCSFRNESRFYVCLVEVFDGIGMLFSFKKRLSSIKKNIEKECFIAQEDADKCLIIWVSQFDRLALDQWSNGRCVCGVIATSDSITDVLWQIYNSNLIVDLEPHKSIRHTSDHIIYCLKEISIASGFFFFFGDFDDSWSDVLVVCRYPD